MAAATACWCRPTYPRSDFICCARARKFARLATPWKSRRNTAMAKIEKSDEEWRRSLTPEKYHVLREKGTERAFSGTYYKDKDPGVFVCGGCGQELFDAATKY